MFAIKAPKVLSPSKKMPATYSFKSINPNNADLEVPKRPTSADEFKAKVCEQFSQYVEGYDTEFGYIIPGVMERKGSKRRD